MKSERKRVFFLHYIKLLPSKFPVLFSFKEVDDVKTWRQQCAMKRKFFTTAETKFKVLWVSRYRLIDYCHWIVVIPGDDWQNYCCCCSERSEAWQILLCGPCFIGLQNVTILCLFAMPFRDGWNWCICCCCALVGNKNNSMIAESILGCIFYPTET